MPLDYRVDSPVSAEDLVHLYDAVGWRNNFHHDFVCFDFHDELISSYRIPFALVPSGHFAIGNRLWECGRFKFDSH